MAKCVSTGEGEYDTKGPSGTAGTGPDKMDPSAPTDGENREQEISVLEQWS